MEWRREETFKSIYVWLFRLKMKIRKINIEKKKKKEKENRQTVKKFRHSIHIYDDAFGWCSVNLGDEFWSQDHANVLFCTWMIAQNRKKFGINNKPNRWILVTSGDLSEVIVLCANAQVYRESEFCYFFFHSFSCILFYFQFTLYLIQSRNLSENVSVAWGKKKCVRQPEPIDMSNSKK